MSLTRQLREELAHTPDLDGGASRAELSALLRVGGAWMRRGGDPQTSWIVESSVGAVVRRARRVLRTGLDADTSLELHRAGELTHEARYRLRVDGATTLCALGLTDPTGLPLDVPPPWLRPDEPRRVAYLRGALMAAAQLSAVAGAPYLEVRVQRRANAEDLATLLREFADAEAGCAPHGSAWRVVVKSGQGIGRLLVVVGAHATFLSFDDGRLRRQLRADANRAANADRANLRRTVSASARQVGVIEGLLGALGDEALPDDLHEVAIARLANPDASLAELASLLGIGRATVHRRLGRLEAMAADIVG